MLTVKSKVMAERLKDLRKQHGLSYVRLAEVINEKYGVVISKDSLVSYEALDENQTRFGCNLKMSATYLLCLADLYGVTTDYLLVNTDDPSIKPSIRDETGLSKNAILYLSNSKNTVGNFESSAFFVNGIFETYGGLILFKQLNKCIFANVAKIALEEIDDDTLVYALNKSPLDCSVKERYDCVASYLSATTLGKTIAQELILQRNMDYSTECSDVQMAHLYQYNASTALSKHCEEYARIVWSELKKELSRHYKFLK